MSASPAPLLPAYRPLPDWGVCRVIVTHYSTGIYHTLNNPHPAPFGLAFLETWRDRWRVFTEAKVDRPDPAAPPPAAQAAAYLAALTPGVVMLHWNATGPDAGFVHFARDCPAFESALDGLDVYDFSEHLKGRYGPDYAPHPRLPATLRYNDAAPLGYLDADDARRTGAGAERDRLRDKLTATVEGICTLYKLELQGRFRPPNGCPEGVPPLVLAVDGSAHHRAGQIGGPFESASHTPEGPQSRGLFWWGGRSVDLSSAALRYNLTLQLWDAESGRPHPERAADEVMRKLWGNEKADDKLKNLVRKLNQDFERNRLAIRVIYRSARLWLVLGST